MMRVSNNSGQALSEFLVALMWLVPFAIGFYTLAQMWNIQITTSKAARYMAWERTAYDEQAYQSMVADPVNGFSAQVTNRFFVNQNNGFGVGGTNLSREWLGWATDKSMVDLKAGVKLSAPTVNDTAKIQANAFLDQTSARIAWLNSQSNVELNTADGAILTVPYSQPDVYTLADQSSYSPEAKSSYMLISDSWAPGSEQMFSDRVGDVRSKVLTNAHRYWVGSPVSSFLAGTFEEIDQKLFANKSGQGNSFDMVSTEQSAAVPSTLGYYQE